MSYEEDQFLCAGCGQAFAAEPPDEFYTKPSMKKPMKKEDREPILVDYDCVTCGQKNTVYWERSDA
jgi:DNA-directed RNA polymerase subunit RPC12/RpoP